VGEHHVEQEQRVTPLELFFDLVFVFALTQVTTFLWDDPTWHGLSRGLLILAALWWAWSGYAWLTNTFDPNEDAVWAAMLVAMAAMFVAALVVPTAFGKHAVLFGVAFLIVHLMHVALFSLAARGDPDLLPAILRLARSALVGAALILAAGFVHGQLRPLLWLIALLVGFFGPLIGGTSGWRVQPAHFVERHGLIVIIALGESLIAIGLGARGTAIVASVIIAALLGLLVATSFWLAYFDFFAIRARQLLADRRGRERIALARDAYTYLHLPMVAGIVLSAFAMRETVAHVHHELATVPALALCGGSAVYLFAYAVIRLRVVRTVGGGRLVAAIAFAILFPLALIVPAIAAVGLVASVWVALHAYEIVWWREARAQARALSARAPAGSS
jgi:low temperature requirement protein LtrA